MQYTSVNDAAIYSEILAPGDVAVWYRKNFTDNVLNAISKISKESIEKTHIKLGEIAGHENFEEIFNAMQGETWSPNGEARELIKSLGLDHTSMSVGDIIQSSSGRLLLVDFAGFAEIK